MLDCSLEVPMEAGRQEAGESLLVTTRTGLPTLASLGSSLTLRQTKLVILICIQQHYTNTHHIGILTRLDTTVFILFLTTMLF